MNFQKKDIFTKENIDELIHFLKNENIRVSVFGEFSTGKSDLGKTGEEQKSIRQYLAEQIKKIKNLEKEYINLDKNISGKL